VNQISQLCGDEKKQLRFLIHNAGTIDPIKNILDVKPDELRHAMNVNVESPFFLTTALYPFMTPLEGEKGVPGRILHVSSGAAHGAPPSGWGCYGITKAAFFQSYRILEKEFRETLGGKVIVGSFRPGVVDTPMQGAIRDSPVEAMPLVEKYKEMKDRASASGSDVAKARSPPAGALDSPDNVAWFVEFLLLGTSDEEFANKDDPSEYDIRNKELFSRWVDPENLARVDY
jgi:benzil reductase ((S)-benzoin forming)